MMEKAALLLFCCLAVSLSGSPLYPSIRFGQRDTSILMTSLVRDPAEPLEAGHVPSATEPDCGAFEFLQIQKICSNSIYKNSERHADAIFTNSYRKVLGQISARKFLQTIMGKRLGDDSYKRESDIYEGTFKEDLTSIQSDQRYRGVHGNVIKPRQLS